MEGLFLLVFVLFVLGGFFAVGYAIASRWKKPPGVTAVYGFLIGLGLVCLSVAVLFGACVCALNNGHL